MPSPLKIVASQLLVLAIATQAQAQARLVEYDLSRRLPFGHTEEIVFEAQDVFKFKVIYGDFPGSSLDLGLRKYLGPDGKPVEVPEYVANVRMVLVAARKYFKDRGLGVDDLTPDNRLTVTIKNTKGKYAGAAELWFRMYRTMVIHNDSDLENLFTTPIHEWFHLVQLHHWRSTYLRENQIALSLQEGTAEWAADQPIPLSPVGTKVMGLSMSKGSSRRVIDLRTADDVNYYFFDNGSNWFGRLPETLWIEDEEYEYSTVFLWKFLGERVGGNNPDAQLKAIAKVWATCESAPAQLALPAMVGPTIRPQSFREFYRDFLVANIVQGGGGSARGFEDDAFGYKKLKYKLIEDRVYSSPADPPLQESVADSEQEISRRLDEIAVPLEEVGQYGMGLLAVKPMWFGRAGNLFLQLSGEGDESWVGAVVLQGAGQLEARTKQDRFSVAPNFKMESKDGRSSGYVLLEGVSGEKGPPYVWAGAANVGNNDTRKLSYAFVASPRFRPIPKKKHPRDSEFIKFVAESSAKRSSQEAFRAGDSIVLDFVLTSKVHSQITRRIPESERSLEVEFVGPDGKPFEVTRESLDWWEDDAERSRPLSKRSGYRYRYHFTIPEDTEVAGEILVRFAARSLLKLGPKDRSEGDWTFRLKEQRPEVKHVQLSRAGEDFVDSRYGISRPVSAGPLELWVTFDEKMDTSKPAEVSWNDNPIKGSWHDAFQWRGSFTLPKDSRERLKIWGQQPLSIQAHGELGRQLDAEPDIEGAQPDTSYWFYVGSAPPILRRLTATGEVGPIYNAHWRESQDGRPGEARRELELELDGALPETGQVRLTAEFNQPVDLGKSSLGYGALRLKFKSVGEDKRVWTASFDVERLRKAMPGCCKVQLAIDAWNGDRMRLDGNPLTPAYYPLTAKVPDDTWKGAEPPPDTSHWLRLSPANKENAHACLPEVPRSIAPSPMQPVEFHWAGRLFGKEKAIHELLVPADMQIQLELERIHKSDRSPGIERIDLYRRGITQDASRNKWLSIGTKRPSKPGWRGAHTTAPGHPSIYTLRVIGRGAKTEYVDYVVRVKTVDAGDMGMHRDAGGGRDFPGEPLDVRLGEKFVGHMYGPDEIDDYRVAHVPEGSTVRVEIWGVKGYVPYAKILAKVRVQYCKRNGNLTSLHVGTTKYARVGTDVDKSFLIPRAGHVIVSLDCDYGDDHKYEARISLTLPGPKAPKPEAEPDKEPKEPEPDAPREDGKDTGLEAEPQHWTRYRMVVEESQFHLDRISLEAVEFLERKLSDGRTVARLKRTLFPVSYAKGTHVTSRIRQRPNRPQIEMADGVKNPEAVRRLRAEAQALRAETTSRVTAEANIKRVVAASLARPRE